MKSPSVSKTGSSSPRAEEDDRCFRQHRPLAFAQRLYLIKVRPDLLRRHRLLIQVASGLDGEPERRQAAPDGRSRVMLSAHRIPRKTGASRLENWPLVENDPGGPELRSRQGQPLRASVPLPQPFEQLDG